MKQVGERWEYLFPNLERERLPRPANRQNRHDGTPPNLEDIFVELGTPTRLITAAIPWASALCPLRQILLVKVKARLRAIASWFCFCPATLFPDYSKRSHSGNN